MNKYCTRYVERLLDIYNNVQSVIRLAHSHSKSSFEDSKPHLRCHLDDTSEMHVFFTMKIYLHILIIVSPAYCNLSRKYAGKSSNSSGTNFE